jgi:hypothetical protein
MRFFFSSTFECRLKAERTAKTKICGDEQTKMAKIIIEKKNSKEDLLVN